MDTRTEPRTDRSLARTAVGWIVAIAVALLVISIGFAILKFIVGAIVTLVAVAALIALYVWFRRR